MIDIEFLGKTLSKPIEIKPCGMYLVQIKSSTGNEVKLAMVAENEVIYIDQDGYTSHSDMEWFKDVYTIIKDIEDSIQITVRKDGN